MEKPKSYDDPYEAMRADTVEEVEADKESIFEGQDWTERDVKVDSMIDLNELLKLPNPMRPTPQMQLAKVVLDDGTVINRPTIDDVRMLKPTKLRPVTFTWRDKSRTQTNAPRQYDEFIQRLLNSGPADMEELVRANWQKFDRAFFFRITELKSDTKDPRLLEKLRNLEKFCMEIIQKAQDQMQRRVPQDAKDAQDILSSVIEEDGTTMLWPLMPAGYSRLAEAITTRSVRAQYEDGWFETILECMERFGIKAEKDDNKALLGLTRVAMQRLVTEWLRHDDLWEETREGQFIFRLMTLTAEQWTQQAYLEKEPLDPFKIKEELKIISENKIVKLPMGSKLQIYAAKYVQGLVEFVESKDEFLKNKDTVLPNVKADS